MADPFSAEEISRHILFSLDPSQVEQIHNEFDIVALTIHAGMLSVGFRVLSVGDGRNKTDCEPMTDGKTQLPAPWNESDSTYTFNYAHSQSSMQFVIKVNRMLRQAIVSGMGDGDDKHQTFSIIPLDHIRPSLKYPLQLRTESSTDSTSLTDAQARIQNDIFQSPARLAEIGKLLKQNIVQKLAPGISKPGYQEEPPDDGDRAADGARPGGRTERQSRDPRPQGGLPDPARPHPYPHDDTLAHPRRPRRDPGELYPPGFTDEYEIDRPPGRSPLGEPGFGIGERDLYPQGLGPRDPMRPFLGPGGGFGGPAGGGGMHPTFDDPMFGGRGGQGQGYDPMAPPGARFDPVGPGQRGGPRGGGYGGGGPPNPFGSFGSGDFI